MSVADTDSFPAGICLMTANLALLPLAGAVARQLVDNVAGAVSNGLSFAASLAASPETANASPEVSATGADTGPPNTTNDARILQWRAAWQQLKREAEDLAQVVRERMAAADIDASDSVALSVDGNGRVLVTRGHWERTRIEQLFEDDPQLRTQVQNLMQRVAAHQDTTGTVGNDLQLIIDADSVTFGQPDGV